MAYKNLEIVQKVLTEADLGEVGKLASTCNQYEELDYLRPNPQMQAILCHENRQLVEFLNLQHGVREVELYLIVHPEKRRQGIATTLLQTAKEQCRKLGIQKCLLVSQESSKSGKAFIESTGSAYQFSEYRMKLEDHPPKQVVDHAVTLQQAGFEDRRVLASIAAECFGDSEQAQLERYTQDLPKATHRFYIGALDNRPIGSIGIFAVDARAYIVAFGVLPEHRRRGYGRQMLTRIVQMLLEEGAREILIEVVTSNRNALTLYRTCGFREQTEYGYYRLRLSP